MLLKDHYSQNTKIITDISNILNWYFCFPLEHININSISYHIFLDWERERDIFTTQSTTQHRKLQQWETLTPQKPGGERRCSWGVSNPCFINYLYQGIMTEYGWKWHDNGIEINKKNLATNNTHFHKKKRGERSLRS